MNEHDAKSLSFRVRFLGVRGSIPSPGPDTRKVGGNTSCVEVTVGEQRIVLDGGTGLRRLGLELGLQAAQQGVRLHLLFSHLHWDHIQGVPFFAPLYHPASELELVGPAGLAGALRSQMSGPSFPICHDQLPARIGVTELAAGSSFRIGPVWVRTFALRHPDGALGYRLELAEGQQALVYVCDHEHPAGALDPALVDAARGADLLIHDAQYLPDELAGRVGWGHSSYAQAAALARAAGVRRLLLTHHDPCRSDHEVAAIERASRQLFPGAIAAREGLVLDLAGVGTAETGAPELADGPACLRRRASIR